MGKVFGEEYTCVYITESLCCSSETNAAFVNQL